MIGTTRTDADGHFSIEGNTANFEGTEANIDPFLKIYHKCDREEKVRLIVQKTRGDFEVLFSDPKDL